MPEGEEPISPADGPVMLLGALVAFLEERDVEGQLSVGLPFLLGVGLLAQGGALRIDAQPSAMYALEDMREDALLVGFARIHLVVERVGSIGHRNIAEHADGDDALIEMDGFILAGDQRGHLLIAGGDVAGRGDIHK